jgi:hypothetical protein
MPFTLFVTRGAVSRHFIWRTTALLRHLNYLFGANNENRAK